VKKISGMLKIRDPEKWINTEDKKDFKCLEIMCFFILQYANLEKMYYQRSL
jgi:hypothetical protein